MAAVVSIFCKPEPARYSTENVLESDTTDNTKINNTIQAFCLAGLLKTGQKRMHRAALWEAEASVASPDHAPGTPF